MPQPVSGVPSPNKPPRTPLAMLDCSLRNAVSLRLALRLPMNSCTPRSIGESRAAMSFGMSAGSFWPSPSSVAIHGARAARTPLATAALCPLRNECRSTRNAGSAALEPARGWPRCRRCCRRRRRSFRRTRAASAASISRASGSTFSASLHTGTTTEISTLMRRRRCQRITRHAKQVLEFRRHLFLQRFERRRLQRARHLARRADGDDDARERPGQHELVPWNSVARLAAKAMGRIGRCDICDSRIAPGLNTKRGPLGPSGVIDGEMPCFTSAS